MRGWRSAVVAGLAVVALTAGCSGSSAHRATPSTTPSTPGRTNVPAATSPYAAAALQQGATSLWSLDDSDRLSSGRTVANAGRSGGTAKVVGGTIAQTKGPNGRQAAQFFRSGRLLTGLTSGLSGKDTFTLAMTLRTDVCGDAWGRVVGTTALLPTGREGIDVVHFPRGFKKSPCKLSVEIWHSGRYIGGCSPVVPAPPTVWTQWTIVHQPGLITCYIDGKRVGGQRVDDLAVGQPSPLGIGGSGSGWEGPLDGVSLQDVTVFPRALTLPEVTRLVRLAHA